MSQTDTYQRLCNRKLGRTEDSADDRCTDSKAELRYGRYLQQRQAKGEIRDLQFQVRIPLGLGQAFMRIDFVYFDVRLDEWVYDDYKPVGWRRMTGYQDWRRKADFWSLLGPGILRVTTQRRGRQQYHYEDIHPRLTGEMASRAIKALGHQPTYDPIEGDRA